MYFLNVLCFGFNPVLLGTYLLATSLLFTYLLATYLLITYLLATYLLATYLQHLSFTYFNHTISFSGDRNRPFFESVEPE